MNVAGAGLFSASPRLCERFVFGEQKRPRNTPNTRKEAKTGGPPQMRTNQSPERKRAGRAQVIASRSNPSLALRALKSMRSPRRNGHAPHVPLLACGALTGRSAGPYAGPTSECRIACMAFTEAW
jgi:hypothetical protein